MRTYFFFFKQKTAYEMRISDWSSDVCSSDLTGVIDNFLSVFTGYIDSGFGLLGGEVAFLSTTLIAIDVTIAGLFWAWGADEDEIGRASCRESVCQYG